MKTKLILRDEVALRILNSFTGVPSPKDGDNDGVAEYRVRRAYDLADEFLKQAGITAIS